MSSRDRKDKVKAKLEKEQRVFVEVADAMSVKDLEAKILSYTKERENLKDILKTKDEIVRAANLLKEIKQPFSDGIKMIDLKVAYMISLIEEKGGDSSGSSEHGGQ